MMFVQDDFARVVSMVEAGNVLMVDAEESLLGYTHAEVGRLLAEKWNLPAKLVNIIAYHHQPDLAGIFSQEAIIVQLADILCRAMNIGSGGDNLMLALNKDGWESLQLDVSAIEPIMIEMEREFDDISLFVTHS